MTWQKPWAVDGPTIPSSVARLAEYAAVGGSEGVVAFGDCKVSPNSPAGGSVLVGAGGVLVTNRSSGGDTQTYVGQNLGNDTITIAPTGVGVTRSDMVVVRVRDPQYSPWPAPAAGAENTYSYVETFVVQGVAASAKTAQGIGLTYSAYALARIDIPANTSAITSGMIVDLRAVANERSRGFMNHQTASLVSSLNPVAGNFITWPGVSFNIDVPYYASVCKVSGFVEGLRLTKAGQGKFRIAFVDGGSTSVTNVDESFFGTEDRAGYFIGGEIAVPTNYRGTSRTIRIEATVNNTASQGFLRSDANSSGMIHAICEERAS